MSKMALEPVVLRLQNFKKLLRILKSSQCEIGVLTAILKLERDLVASIRKTALLDNATATKEVMKRIRQLTAMIRKIRRFCSEVEREIFRRWETRN